MRDAAIGSFARTPIAKAYRRAIAFGHPSGMTGSRLVGYTLVEARRRGLRWGMLSMWKAGGVGAADLVEIV